MEGRHRRGRGGDDGRRVEVSGELLARRDAAAQRDHQRPERRHAGQEGEQLGRPHGSLPAGGELEVPCHLGGEEERQHEGGEAAEPPLHSARRAGSQQGRARPEERGGGPVGGLQERALPASVECGEGHQQRHDRHPGQEEARGRRHGDTGQDAAGGAGEPHRLAGSQSSGRRRHGATVAMVGWPRHDPLVPSALRRRP